MPGESDPFAVPCGDGIGEAVMAAHMEEEHGESAPSRRLGRRHLRHQGIDELSWGSHDSYYVG